jgi:hypothetical protein
VSRRGTNRGATKANSAATKSNSAATKSKPRATKSKPGETKSKFPRRTFEEFLFFPLNWLSADPESLIKVGAPFLLCAKRASPAHPSLSPYCSALLSQVRSVV